MTARPLDYGDPFPSDVGDVAPSDPTTAFVERDYRVKSSTARSIPARREVRASPNLRTEPNTHVPRTGFTGTIVKRERKNQYKIIRQDGRTIIGYIHGDDCVYDSLKPGEEVTLMDGQKPGFYHIVGRTRQNEMDAARFINSSDTGPTSIAQLIPIDIVLEESGEEPFYELTPEGTILITKDITGDYEISVTVYVELSPDPQATTSATIVTFMATADRDSNNLYFNATMTGVVSGQNPPPGVGAADAIQVFDTSNLFPYVLQNSPGYAIWDEQSSVYRVIQAQQMCITAKAIIDESTGIAPSVADVAISGFTPTSMSPFSLFPTTIPKKAGNPYKHQGQFGNQVDLRWDMNQRKWIIVDVFKQLRKTIVGTNLLKINDNQTALAAEITSCGVEYSAPPFFQDKISLTTCGGY